MTASINRQSPHGLAALSSVFLAGTGEFELGTMIAILITDGNDLSETAKWEAVALLTTGSYERKTLTVTGISTSGSTTTVTVTPPTWTALVSPDSGDISHVLFAWKRDGFVTADSAGGTDLRVPLFMMDAVLTPSDYGNDFTPVAPAGGFISFDTPNS